MEWWLVILLVMGALMALMATRMPIAFCFLLVEFIAAILLWGPKLGPGQIVLSMRESVGNPSLLPLPLFILMGTAMFHAGIAPLMIDALDKWLTRVPARLSLLAIAAGTVLATLTGASPASTAILGTSLVPEMEKRGYKPDMIMGPIMAGGGLAPLIPPSGLAILVGVIGELDVGKMLIAMIVPGVMLAFIYTTYYVIRALFNPNLAPSYKTPPIPLGEKISCFACYVLPIGIIIFLVTGVIFLGIATPSEAAATGALGTFILAGFYRRLNWEVTKKSITEGLQTGGMMLMIIVGANAFAEILAFTGATPGLVKFALALPVPPIITIIMMQIVVIILGMPLNPGPIAMLCLPVFMPIIRALHFNEIWFAIIFLINLELSQVSPPVGMDLYVMKGVSKYSMGEVFKASLPVCLLELLGMALVIAFPALVLWLPTVMH